jgi:hypothetical protein
MRTESDLYTPSSCRHSFLRTAIRWQRPRSALDSKAVATILVAIAKVTFIYKSYIGEAFDDAIGGKSSERAEQLAEPGER